MNIFEQATRMRLRFPTAQGAITVEDLWEIPLTSKSGKTNLNDIAVGLYNKLQESTGIVSFVEPNAPNDKQTQLAFDIAKYIIDVRVAERAAAKDAADRREKKARILEIIADKQDDALRGKSLEELTALGNSL